MERKRNQNLAKENSQLEKERRQLKAWESVLTAKTKISPSPKKVESNSEHVSGSRHKRGCDVFWRTPTWRFWTPRKSYICLVLCLHSGEWGESEDLPGHKDQERSSQPPWFPVLGKSYGPQFVTDIILKWKYCRCKWWKGGSLRKDPANRVANGQQIREEKLEFTRQM